MTPPPKCCGKPKPTRPQSRKVAEVYSSTPDAAKIMRFDVQGLQFIDSDCPMVRVSRRKVFKTDARYRITIERIDKGSK